MRTFACCEEVLKEQKRSLSRQTSVLDFFKSSSGTHSSPPVLLGIGDMIQTTLLQFKAQSLLLKLLFSLSEFRLFCKFFISMNISLSLAQSRLSGISLPVLRSCLWESLSRPTSTYVVLLNRLPVSEPPTTQLRWMTA
jgi:hypothetical protein